MKFTPVTGGGADLYLLPGVFSFLLRVAHIGVISTTFLSTGDCGYIGYLNGSTLKGNTSAIVEDMKLLSIGIGPALWPYLRPIAYGIGTFFTRVEN